ncbi:hypothetical protein Cgig2_002981 [Carnegiea gigantea]|uniref:Ubiquitin-like protease family profile domain-containing protein n=1 Tax=Carnegiea gigantea TaxID=171969 RepID=A0A9Q1K614_9CARY|nr:hypothetical protein Cgig2_002981 [Carnegiea gigantea]
MTLRQPLSNHVQNMADKNLFEDLDFFNAYLKMEVIALKHFQGGTPVDYTPPTFKLGIPLSPVKGTPSVKRSPIKMTHMTISSPTCNDEQVCFGDYEDRHTIMDIVANIAMQYSNLDQHKATTNCGRKMRSCMSSMHDKAHRLWIYRETIALMAAADNHLENSIVDVWSIIMNNDQLSRQKGGPKRFYFTIYVYKASFKYHEFYEVMQLETQRTNWLNLNKAYLVSFPILRSEHFFLVVFQFVDKTVNIMDNLTLSEKPSIRYDNYDTPKCCFSKYAIQRGHPRAKEVKDFRTVYTMRHMETYYGDLQACDSGFHKEKVFIF